MASNFPSDQAIVVGGGLGGMSAANTVVENGGRVVLLDKSSFCGGNSTKATSGINGANTKAQKAKGINDTTEIFVSDTVKGGAKKPDLVQVLCANSGADVEWLMDKFNLDLSLVARLGGHSNPRTHRGKERFPGMTITYALIQMLEKISEVSDKARIITKAHVNKLIMNDGNCVGCHYEKGGATFKEFGPVIIASGGFGADFSNDSLLAKYRPDLLHLPTTNGEHCTGDGIKMGEAIGAKTIDLEWVQVHPTGLVKPDDADAKIKFLAAEALRGVGGLVLDKNGKRFANELGRRDYVTGEMWKGTPPFRLVLNKAASDEIIWHCKHYTGRGVMKAYNSGEELAKDMGIDVAVLEKTHEDHYQAAQKTAKDPDGGPFPAYPSGKSWDEASGKTGSGKKFYHNIISGSQVRKEPFYVAIITPVIHYTMGGLEIQPDATVISAKTKKGIPGLYAAGEVAGGVHGNNRLGGNSLLDCVVFGRVAGVTACKHMLGKDLKAVDIIALTGGGLSGEVKASKNAGGSYEDNMNQGKSGGGAAVAAKSGGGGGGGGGKSFTMADVQKHTKPDDCWVVLHGQVLDVTKFLKQHPGGDLAILTFAGKDATAEFDMIHPPGVVEKYFPEGVIGALGDGSSAPAEAGGGLDAPLLASGDGKAKNYARAQKNFDKRMAGYGKIKGPFGALCYMVLGFMKEIIFTIFPQKNIVFNNDRVGLTRSAMFLFVFIIIHAIGNLHVFLGPDDFNGYGYFYVRLYWTGFGFQMNIVEEYVLLCALMHVAIALKRTWDISMNFKVKQGNMNLAFSGIMLLTFMLIHLFQFRFGDTAKFPLCPPPYMINLNNLLQLSLFWVPVTKEAPCEMKMTFVRDIYNMEFEIFKSLGWTLFYISSVVVFTVHLCLGWQKCVGAPQLDIPKRFQRKATHIGYVMTAFISIVYVSFPFYAHVTEPKKGDLEDTLKAALQALHH